LEYQAICVFFNTKKNTFVKKNGSQKKDYARLVQFL